MFLIMVQLALRNLVAHRIKSLVVGTILAFGTMLVVTGSAILDSIEASMQRSITSSLAGQLQVYDANAKDALALYGGLGMGSMDIGEIPEFEKVDQALSGVEGVKAVVPMGIVTAVSFSGNEIDRLLDKLRGAQAAGDQAGMEQTAQQIRSIVRILLEDVPNRKAVTVEMDKVLEEEAALKEADTDAFWAKLATEPDAVFTFLDTRIAPQSMDGRIYYLRIIGTDIEGFTQSFDRFYVVDGQPIPPGERGILLSKRTYERIIKNLVARELDDVQAALKDGKTIAGDPLIQQQIARNAKQYQRITFQLKPADAAALVGKLQALVPGGPTDLDALLQAFLTVDDSNFAERYAFFYKEIAPLINLYEIPVGSEITLRGFTQSGYIKAVKVKVWGTYEFKGLEEADLATASNLADLVTFRELYGKMTDRQRDELAAIKASVGVREVSRGSIEDDLFGGSAAPAEATPTNTSVGFDESVLMGDELSATVDQSRYTRAEIRNGLALNAAVLLNDTAKISEVQAKIQEISKDLNIQVVDWQTAAGLLGQFITVIRVVLFVAISIIFLVALVIINNTMLMATMDRVGEIGTMRAIGAQRFFVMSMFILETLVLGVITGGLGALAGVGIVSWLGSVGIPAVQDALVILFAGPRLYPTVNLGNIVFAMASILVVSLLSTFYPARMAASISPRVAMAGKE